MPASKSEVDHRRGEQGQDLAQEQLGAIRLGMVEKLFRRRLLDDLDRTEWSPAEIRAAFEGAQLVDDPANTVFYACGTNEMVEAVEHLVTHDLALPKEQMKTEKWG